MAVADQVDLRLAADSNDFLDLGQQFLATQFRCVELADFGDVDLRAVSAQRTGDAIPIVDAQQTVETQHAVGEHNRVLRGGVAAAGGSECLTGKRQGASETEGEQGFVLVHGRTLRM